MVNNNKADSCLGVYPVPAAFQLTKQFVRNNEGVKFIGPANVNRQQLPLSYVRSGEFYLSRVGLIREEQSLLGGRLEMLETALPFVNIDSVEDVERAINIPEKALD
jgi:CMP-N-acetylneuraminic acid synthetase